MTIKCEDLTISQCEKPKAKYVHTINRLKRCMSLSFISP